MDDSARAIAKLNRALYDTVRVDSVQTGAWDDARTFTADVAPPNAVHVVVSYGTNRMMTAMFGLLPPRVKARATAWADAPVASTGCIKPWAIPYVTLMERLNAFRGLPNPWDTKNRAFTQADMDALKQMTPAQRSFNRKLGSGQIVDTSSTAMPSNYQAVELPK